MEPGLFLSRSRFYISLRLLSLSRLLLFKPLNTLSRFYYKTFYFPHSRFPRKTLFVFISFDPLL